MTHTGTTRRRALAGAGVAAAALLTGCTTEHHDRARAGGRDAEEAATRALLARSAATCSTLLGRYEAVLARHPAEAARLAPLRDAVARHVAALSAPPVPGAPAAAPSPAPATADSRSLTVSADPVEAVRALATAERRAAAEHTAALMDAPPEVARLLASVAAANAGHLYLLSQGATA